MKANITFISASAGSGKTYRITEIVEERLAQGACRPGGLIATTFTVKAAQELRERVRRRLYDSGHLALAERLHEGLIGTVDSVCGQLLQRFAFEAGISPSIEILAEEEAAMLLAQAVETVVDFDTLRRLHRLADLLGQRDAKKSEYHWKSQVRQVLTAARANDLPQDSLVSMGRQGVDELVAFLPDPTKDDLDAQLAAALQQSIQHISGNGDETATTAKYVELLRDAHQALRAGRLPWSDWVKLSKERPGKKSQTNAAPVSSAASRVERHPRLRQDIADYATSIFDIACRSLAEFRRLKEERGLLDFADLEQRALHLLRDQPIVRETLAAELDLLVVDEFQDTSPIQLALFMQLAACARETVWVGDVKQAIYGFRNGDPDLIKAVVEHVRKDGTLADPLSKSWRSTPELVALTNALFVPAFATSLGLPAAEVQLRAQRQAIRPAQPALELFELSSGQIGKTTGKLRKLTNDQYAVALAEGVGQMLTRNEKFHVQDKETRQLRALEPRDIAVLCRTNDAAERVADALTQRGLAVTLSQSGLLATPEARLGLAALRRLADPFDTLASAEIVALEATGTPEDWLESRIEYVAQRRQKAGNASADRWGLEEPFVDPGLVALENARGGLNVLSPSEALDAALNCAGVFATVSSWGPSVTRAAQRRGNLESLRALAARYEEACLKNHVPATVAGFLFWCDDQAEAKSDAKAADEQVNAIHVSTYHKAKGLEWPVVVCTDLDAEPRPRLWEITMAPVDSTKRFDALQPLSNRRVRFWPWPFGGQQTGVPLNARIESDAFGQAARRKADEEELRLLYVALTRARDQLVLVLEEDQPARWLDILQAHWLRVDTGTIALPDNTKLSSPTLSLTPPADIAAAQADLSYAWFPAPLSPTPGVPARLTPSGQPPIAGARAGRIIDLGSRLPLAGTPDEADLGDVLHAILAAELIDPGHPGRSEMVRRVLGGYGLSNCLGCDDVLAMADRFRSSVEREFRPARMLVETPLETTNERGQRIEGFIDLLLETPTGWVVIDHKSFPGARSGWKDKAISYSGQLALYRQALGGLNLPFTSIWVHFAVGGGLVEVLLDARK